MPPRTTPRPPDDPVQHNPHQVAAEQIRQIAGDAAREEVEREAPRWAQVLIADVKQILENQASAKTEVELIKLRVGMLEKIVFSLAGVVGLTVAGAVLSLVIRSPGDSRPLPPVQPVQAHP